MSLLSLLGTLFSKPSKAGGDASEPSADPQIAPEGVAGEGVDNGVRMHIAAHDPAFPAKRAAAIDRIVAAIDTVALAHGFTKKAKSWAKTGDLGTVSIHLQRSRFGFDCLINLGFQPLSEMGIGPWALDDFVALEHFCPVESAAALGTLTYLDVHDDAANLTETMDILSDRALPWLLAHLTDLNAPNLPMRPDHLAES
jgi:hypothetical protein